MDKEKIIVGAKLKCESDSHAFVKKGDTVKVELIDCSPYRSQRCVKFEGIEKRSYIDNVARCFVEVT